MANILLVEPDLLLGEVYKQFLETRHHQVYWKRTAESSVQLLDQAQIDLIILELQMAGHNGLEFLYEIRSYQDWIDTPVIVNTSIDSKLIDVKLLKEQLGVTDFIHKSVSNLSKLDDVINMRLLRIKK